MMLNAINQPPFRDAGTSQIVLLLFVTLDLLFVVGRSVFQPKKINGFGWQPYPQDNWWEALGNSKDLGDISREERGSGRYFYTCRFMQFNKQFSDTPHVVISVSAPMQL